MGHIYKVEKEDKTVDEYALTDNGILTNETELCMVGKDFTHKKAVELFQIYMRGKIVFQEEV